MSKKIRIVRDSVDEKLLIERNQASLTVLERGTESNPKLFVSTSEQKSEFESLPGWKNILCAGRIRRYEVNLSRDAFLKQIQEIYHPEPIEVTTL